MAISVEVASTLSNGVLNPSTGEANPAAKLTDEQAKAIRIAARAGGKVTYLARAFDVSERAVRHIARGTTWAHI